MKVSHLHSINKRLTAHERVVASVPKHRDCVQRGCAEDQGVPKPVRDDAQLPLTLPSTVSAGPGISHGADVEASVTSPRDGPAPPQTLRPRHGEIFAW